MHKNYVTYIVPNATGPWCELLLVWCSGTGTVPAQSVCGACKLGGIMETQDFS